MALTLKLRSGDLTPHPELQIDAPRIVVGRASGCEMQLPDPSVSSRHASIRQRGSEYVVVDEGSENGTFSGLTRLVRQAPHTLRDGELLRFGRVWVEVRLEPSQGTIESGASRELARKLVEHALEQGDQPRGMQLLLDGGESLRLEKQRHAYSIGSHKGADLRLPKHLPARCLELRRQGDQLWVTRLGSDANAHLDGAELVLSERTLWPKGAVLELAEQRLSFSDPTSQVLDQLERGPTERLSPDDVVDPPEGAPMPTDMQWAGADKPSSRDADRSPTRGAAALASNEPFDRRWATNPEAERWTSADALVFLLALGVLGLSLWAIQWLARLGPV
jgi:pSer/pThr/pTyr-binding forkhead associated (FHA) protein